MQISMWPQCCYAGVTLKTGCCCTAGVTVTACMDACDGLCAFVGYHSRGVKIPGGASFLSTVRHPQVLQAVPGPAVARAARESFLFELPLRPCSRLSSFCSLDL